jgi:hypothetical protein
MMTSVGVKFWLEVLFQIPLGIPFLRAFIALLVVAELTEDLLDTINQQKIVLVFIRATLLTGHSVDRLQGFEFHTNFLHVFV